MSWAEGCPFCEIIQREDPDAREVYRDEHVVAFFPTEPAVLGHTMVVPRKHAATWSTAKTSPLPERVNPPLGVMNGNLAVHWDDRTGIITANQFS